MQVTNTVSIKHSGRHSQTDQIPSILNTIPKFHPQSFWGNFAPREFYHPKIIPIALEVAAISCTSTSCSVTCVVSPPEQHSPQLRESKYHGQKMDESNMFLLFLISSRKNVSLPAICATNIAASKTSAAEHGYISCNVRGKRDEPLPNASRSTSTKQYDQNTS